MSEITKIAFVGAGAMTAAHMQAFKDIENVELSGIVSSTKAKAESLSQKFGVKDVCDSIEELYERTKADLLVISVPVLHTRKVCVEAFHYPWKLLIEKPVGHNLLEAEHLRDLAVLQGREAFVALNRRQYGSTANVQNALAGNDAPRLIHVFDQEDLIAAKSNGHVELVIQNWMYANSIHMIDFFRMFGRGDIVSVEPVIAWNPDAPSFVSAKIQFSSGDIGLYDAVWNGPGPWAVTVTTKTARFEMRPVEQASIQLYPSRKLEPLPEHVWDKNFKPGLRRQAEESIKAVKGEPHDLVSLAEGVETMKLVSAIYEI
ncbi:Gfo/Idh/MocA family oxidoreductase [Chlorobium phaeovibrioides]|uniref:Gfo/Idh/MocA family protein n=1 Tax=Chlorobium phaeovibrioides TaxID=1094 RepID=UPI000F83BBEF|nr:Gfo/Idh/MocA family oxidoreductase [Chlorobium phaeovibrioides]RTY34144.1 Gfo/Idh/MocA family oxidoreductase [Chlorobium phaeovibrioides]